MSKKLTIAQFKPKWDQWKIKVVDFILNHLPLLKIGSTNRLIDRFTVYKNENFVKEISDYLNQELSIVGLENIPKNGALTIVSNHPGGCDIFATVNSISKVRNDIKVLANELICIDNIKDIIIPVKLFGKKKVDESIVEEAYKDGNAIVFFAAGKNSRYNEEGILMDRRWRTTFLQNALKFDTPIIVMRIEAKNSPLFYKVSHLRESFKFLKKIPLENFFQLRELTKQKLSTRIFFSKPIYLNSNRISCNNKELRAKSDELYNFLYKMDHNNLNFK